MRLSFSLIGIVAMMTVEGSRCNKFSELVSNHILGDVNRNMLSAVVNGNRMTNKGREDRGTAGPSLDYSLVAASVHSIYSL